MSWSRRSNLFPISQLMIHGVIVASHGDALHWGLDTFDAVDFTQEVWSFVALGLQLQELYVAPRHMTDEAWDILAEGLQWARREAVINIYIYIYIYVCVCVCVCVHVYIYVYVYLSLSLSLSLSIYIYIYIYIGPRAPGQPLGLRRPDKPRGLLRRLVGRRVRTRVPLSESCYIILYYIISYYVILYDITL